MNENSIQNHGSVKLDLDIPWARLISPLPDEAPPPSLASWNTSPPSPDRETALPSLTLNTYLDMCRHHSIMTEHDLQFNRAVYEMIQRSGEKGVSVGTLRGHSSLHQMVHTLPLEEHIQWLLNFDMVRYMWNYSSLNTICPPLSFSLPPSPPPSLSPTPSLLPSPLPPPPLSHTHTTGTKSRHYR